MTYLGPSVASREFGRNDRLWPNAAFAVPARHGTEVAIPADRFTTPRGMRQQGAGILEDQRMYRGLATTCAIVLSFAGFISAAHAGVTYTSQDRRVSASASSANDTQSATDFGTF